MTYIDPHVTVIRPVAPRTPLGCEECLLLGGAWLDLRQCLTCGKVSCCDASMFAHAREHARLSGHPIVLSFEPGESWRWCYTCERFV
jgi:uncharacterized UBP type Zn finger protein